MTKTIIRLSAAVMFAVLLAAAGMMLTAVQSFAADSYNYTIRISAGNEGVFADGSRESVQTVAAGSAAAVDLDELGVTLTDDTYYAKGLRMAGHDDGDNPLVRSKTISNVQEDSAFVVVYGIRSSLVKYTVRYLDEGGNALLPEAEYYGAVGDKPVVSFRYVNGYAPTAYNETKTLSENEDENVFTFRYYESTVVVTPDNTNNNTATTTSGGRTSSGSSTSAGSGTATTRTPAAGAAGPTGNAATANTDTAAQSAAVNEATPGTPDLVDLDDEDVPLAAPDASALADSDSNAGTSNAIWFILIAAGMALIVLAIIFYRRRHSQRA